jgi:hypothetical protein
MASREDWRQVLWVQVCHLLTRTKIEWIISIEDGGGRSQAHERGSICSFFPWPDSILISVLSLHCVEIKLICCWLVDVLALSLYQRPNQPTKKQTNKPAQRTETFVKKQPFSFWRNTRHFWNPSVVFTTARHLAKWNLQTLSRTFSLTSATTQVPKAMSMILLLSNYIFIQLVKIHTRFGDAFCCLLQGPSPNLWHVAFYPSTRRHIWVLNLV